MSHDAAGKQLYLTPTEHEAEARARAERRVNELTAELEALRAAARER